MDVTLAGRLSVTALGDVERFVEAAQHLKALATQRHELRCRDSRRLAALSQQIDTFTLHCGALAQGNARLGELWKLTQEELRPLLDTAAPAAPLAGCSAGARAK